MAVEVKRKIFLVFVFLLVLGTTQGCLFGSTDNPHEDWVLISDSAARSMGKSSASQLEEQVGLYESDTYTRYLENVGSKVAVYTERSELDYEFKILDTFLVNALALPGGYVYVTRGLMQELENEAQLGAIIAHELAHVNAYHSVKRSQLKIGSILVALAAAGRTEGRSLGGGLIGSQMISRGYSRSAEYQADKLGIKYLRATGYPPRSLVEFLEYLRQEKGARPDRRTLMLRTHPFLKDRISRLKLMLAEDRGLEGKRKLTNRGRFNRYRRKYLFADREQAVLDQLDGLINAYENQDVEEVKSHLSSQFKVGGDTDSDTGAEEFIVTLKDRFSRFERIDYSRELYKLENSDTSVTVVFGFTEKRLRPDKQKPDLVEGYQKMVWQREEEEWQLISLR